MKDMNGIEIMLGDYVSNIKSGWTAQITKNKDSGELEVQAAHRTWALNKRRAKKLLIISHGGNINENQN